MVRKWFNLLDLDVLLGMSCLLWVHCQERSSLSSLPGIVHFATCADDVDTEGGWKPKMLSIGHP